MIFFWFLPIAKLGTGAFQAHPPDAFSSLLVSSRLVSSLSFKSDFYLPPSMYVEQRKDKKDATATD